MRYHTTRRSFLLGIPALFVLAAGGGAAGWGMRSVPDDLDLSLYKASEAGRYQVEIAPEAQPVAVGTMHAWILSLRDAGGAPVGSATIAVDGGMPRHGHGLPTAPAATEALGDGRFLIEGMKFNMHGWWVIDFAIDGSEGPDSVSFNLVL